VPSLATPSLAHFRPGLEAVAIPPRHPAVGDPADRG
jgi:hypothetical protein